MVLKFACIGDIHGFWEGTDSEYFNESEYDFLLLTGDLPNHKSFINGSKILYQRLNQISIPTYMSLGNWDGANYLQLIGEVYQIPWMIQFGSLGHETRVRNLKRELSNIRIGAYEILPLKKRTISFPENSKMNFKFNSSNQNLTDISNHRIGLLIGRPFSGGGPNLAFRPSLQRKYGISSISESVGYYKKLIDSTKHHYDSLILLAHNGPSGLGDRASDIFGCDFRKEEGDWGDLDLEEAIEYSKSQGIHVPLVVGGHMHHRNPKTKSERKMLVEKDGTVYLNVAKVPRNGGHYAVELIGSKVSIKEICF